MLKYIEMKESEIISSKEVDAQLSLPDSWHQLNDHHFPMFLTVQKLIYMLDGAIWNSFFSRTHDRKIQGLDSNLGWHNEDKGVFMINQHFKEVKHVQDSLREFEFDLLQNDMDLEAE